MEVLNINLKRLWFALVWKTIYIMGSDSTGYYIDVDDARDDYDDNSSSLYSGNNWGQRCGLPTRKSSAYVKAKNAKVGETITCANCGKKIIKKTYQQKFCCDNCKNKYHNRRFK